MEVKQDHTHNHGFQFKGALKRAIQEYHYFTCKGWSLKEVGDFWDSVTDYDDINENTYSYYRRFTNSYDLTKPHLQKENIICDIQARSGKGTDFWFEKGYVKKSYLVDFSDFLLSLARERLKNTNYDYETIKVLDYSLPFDNHFFDLVLFYETIEHIGRPELLIRELSRVLKKNGIMILTCPNILWEPVHWFSAVFNIHHSEGPHNFLRRKHLLRLFRENNLEILEENTTVLLPFNKKQCIVMNEWLEARLPEQVKRVFALRRSFVLKKRG